MGLSEEFLNNINIKKCKWANDKLELFDLGKFQKFKYFITKYSKTNQKILLSSIVGTDHFSYGNKETWLSMLSNGKRIEKNLRSYLDKPNFFENHDKYNYPHNLSYSTINGSDYYISGSGNHRTIIAKFVFAEQPNKYLNGVNITYHKINYDFYNAYQELKSFCKNTTKFDTYSELKDNVSSVVIINKSNNDRLKLHNENEIKYFISQENTTLSKIRRFLDY